VPPRRPAQRRHDAGVAARRGADEVLGDALIVYSVAGEQRGRTRVELRRIHGRDPLARRRRHHGMDEFVRARVEHSLVAQLLLGRDGLRRPEPGDYPRPARIGVRTQDCHGARQRDRCRRQSPEPVTDEAHELRRRAVRGQRLAQRAGATLTSLPQQLVEIQRIATGHRARPRHQPHSSRTAERRLNETSSPGRRQRRRFQPHERSLRGQHGMRMPRRGRPGGDDERQRQPACATGGEP
jgi:hypothetical protein